MQCFWPCFFIIHSLSSKTERDIELCLKSEIHSSTNGKKSLETQNRTIPKDNFIGWKNTSDFNDSGNTYLSGDVEGYSQNLRLGQNMAVS